MLGSILEENSYKLINTIFSTFKDVYSKNQLFTALIGYGQVMPGEVKVARLVNSLTNIITLNRACFGIDDRVFLWANAAFENSMFGGDFIDHLYVPYPINVDEMTKVQFEALSIKEQNNFVTRGVIVTGRFKKDHKYSKDISDSTMEDVNLSVDTKLKRYKLSDSMVARTTLKDDEPGPLISLIKRKREVFFVKTPYLPFKSSTSMRQIEVISYTRNPIAEKHVGILTATWLRGRYCVCIYVYKLWSVLNFLRFSNKVFLYR